MRAFKLAALFSFIVLFSGETFISAGQNLEKVSIKFKQDFRADDLVIKEITAQEKDNHIVFTVIYESGKNRFLSLFNPPNGDKVMHFEKEGLMKDGSLVTFSIQREKFREVGTLTMRFSDPQEPEQDMNFLYLDIQEKAVKALLGAAEAAIQVLPKGKVLESVSEYQDVRWANLTQIKENLTPALIATLRFNQETNFGINKDAAEIVMEKAKNPGMGIRSLHARGITGKGVAAAIIDQNLCLNHPEFKGKIIKYKDVGTDQPANWGSMHAPGVMSLLAGDTIGTAPDAMVYFAAAPSWTKDAAFQAEALEWVIDVNNSLPAGSKIRVVSISAAPSGPGSPFDKNNDQWDEAVKKAKAEGILVLDCTRTNGIIGPGYYDIENPDDLSKFRLGFPGYKGDFQFPQHLLYVPCSPRTVAEEYQDGNPGYQFTGRGGLSWAIPFAAGVCALGWQIKPELTAEQVVDMLMKTAYVTQDSYKVINPAGFITALERM